MLCRYPNDYSIEENRRSLQSDIEVERLATFRDPIGMNTTFTLSYRLVAFSPIISQESYYPMPKLKFINSEPSIGATRS
jgi:hypothetical protein